jgi:hypothetical protein
MNTNCGANTQLETTIVIGMYNAQQENQLYGPFIASMIRRALQVSSFHHLHCFQRCSIAHPLLAKLSSLAPQLFRFCAHINTVLTVATFQPSCCYKAQAVYAGPLVSKLPILKMVNRILS